MNRQAKVAATRKHQLLTMLMMLAVGISNGLAAPTGPEGVPVEAQQPDGTVLDIRGYGDDFYHRYETADGYTVVRDRQANIWYYAQTTKDGSDLVPSAYRVGRDDPAAGGLDKHVERSGDAIRAIVADRYDRFVRPSNWERRRVEGQIARLHSLGEEAAAETMIQTYNTRYAPMGYRAMVSSDEGPRFSSPSAPSYTPPPTMSRTNVVALCILAQFPDQPAPTFTQTQMAALINQASYVDPNGNAGSVRDYFFAQSFGKLSYTAIVTAYITADHPRSYYANENDCYGGIDLIRECIGKVSGVNLSTLTKEGSTAVAVYLLYAGATGYDGLWPHQSTLSPSPQLSDGTRVADYMVSSIGTTPVVGTICHESGHMVLGCFDYYDYGNGRYGCGDSVKSAGVGRHCLMGAGNHLNGGKTPAPISAYLKYKLGWATTVDFPASGSLSIGAADQQFRRFVKPGKPAEYFIVENKSKIASLPWNGAMVDEGLAVWHVDESVTTGNELQQMTSAQHYELSLEQADGQFDLETKSAQNPGDATDYFDGAAGRNAFSPTTLAGSKWWDGSSSELTLGSISTPGATLTCIVSVGGGGSLPAPVLNAEPPTTPGTANTISWQAVAGASNEVAVNGTPVTDLSSQVRVNSTPVLPAATLPGVGPVPNAMARASGVVSGTPVSGVTTQARVNSAPAIPTATTLGFDPGLSATTVPGMRMTADSQSAFTPQPAPAWGLAQATLRGEDMGTDVASSAPSVEKAITVNLGKGTLHSLQTDGVSTAGPITLAAPNATKDGSSAPSGIAAASEGAAAVEAAEIRPKEGGGPDTATEQKGEPEDGPLLATTQMLAETFEGAFPGSSWTLMGSPTWDDTNYDRYGGSWSGWCADSAVIPANGYPDNMNGWMIYGPFSLSDATAARLVFWYKNYSESNRDYFKWMVSVDNTQFYGYAVSGNQNSWRSETFDLTTVPTLGNLCGRSQVWIAFVFTSDASGSGPTYTGAYVDDVVLEKESVAADLTAHKPANWNDKIPVGITQVNGSAEHSYSGAYYDNQELYFNWASINQGSETASGYKVHAEVTGTGGGAWDWAGLTTAPTVWTYLTTDGAIGPLSAGTHTLKVWVDYDGTVNESNEGNNYYERTITVTSAASVNLTPYQPSGWSDKVVVSKATGTKTDDRPLYDTDALYVDWAVVNNGPAVTAARFYTELYVDGELRYSWHSDPPINPFGWQYAADYAIGSLSAGTHTLRIKVDSGNAIAESNEGDNEYTKTITVISPPLPNLTPYQPSGWSDKVVVSKLTGTHTDGGPIYNTDTLYVDWAVINGGAAATAARFHTELYVDGVLQHSWYSDPPVNPSGWQYSDDYSIGTLSAGTHTLRIKTDSGNAIAESNESDNEYTKTVTVIASSLSPNLTPFQPSGWSDKVVVSKVTGTYADDRPLYDTDTLYVDWAAINIGAAATAARFYTELYVDGVLQTSWYTDPPFNPNSSYVFVPDYSIGTLSAGTHTIRIKVDSGNAITESNESDNEYTKTITVISPTLPNLTPYQPSGWSDTVVVSKVTGTCTDDDSLHETDTLYVDWAVINNGSTATTVRFYTQLYVDGALQASWYSDPPVNPAGWQYASDYAIGTLSAGTHTIRVKVDSGSAIAESNESDNEYTKTITIIGADASTEYYAECDDDASFSSPMNSGWVANTQYTFSNLSPGVKYYYRVKARRGAGLLSGWSNSEFSTQASGGGVSLAEAVDDVSGLSWNSEGSAVWFGQAVTSHDSVDAAQSGDVGDDQSSALLTSVTGPGTLSFWWKTSSEENWDFLRFYVDGTEQSGSISGEVGWQQMTFTVGEGVHTLKWAYTKDSSVSSSADCGWLDQVAWQASSKVIVTFDAQGGATPTPASKNVTYGSAYGTLATTTRTAYTFGGWYTGAGGTGTLVTDVTTVATAVNHKLYAKWTVLQDTVTFDAQGGEAPNPASKTVTYGSMYGTLPTPSRTGYAFLGWWTVAGGTGSQVTDVTIVTTAASHVLYAKWTANPYTVTFDAQGGTAPSPASKSVTYGSTYGTLATTTRTNYTFAGWWTGAGGTGTEVTATTTVTLTAAQTLYANWVVYGINPPGDGTAANPYQISQLSHLVWMCDTVGSSAGTYYSLMGDIDAADTANWNDTGTDTTVAEGFRPIGTEGHPFSGVFAGNGHAIHNLFINRSGETAVGLFGYVSNGTITNIALVGGAIVGDSSVGGLVGYYSGGNMSGCYATCAVTGAYNVGGLVGSAAEAIALTHCCARGAVALGADGEDAGGLVGSARWGATLSQCYATGTVTGGAGGVYVGGLVGFAFDADLSQCYATGVVMGDGYSSDVGGLVGCANETTISQCYATGAATGLQQVGGLAGWAGSGTTLLHCYAAGPVTGLVDAGGLVGSREEIPLVTDSYWDASTTGVATSGGGGQGITTAEMKHAVTFVGWDFAAAWNLAESVSYPYLRWSPSPFGLEVNVIGRGTVVQNLSAEGYVTGIVVALSATAEAGFVFCGWLGSVEAADSASTTVTMDIHKSVTAVFRRSVHSITELQMIGNDPGYPLDGSYALTQDLDAAATASWDGGAGFAPIGTAARPFTGVVDGQGHAIRNLTINRPGQDNVGLFGVVAGGTIRRLEQIGGSVAGNWDVGGLVGKINDGTLARCHVTTVVTGTGEVGGLVGYASYYGMIVQCIAQNTATGNTAVGGLVGYASQYHTILQCYATGAATGNRSVGGLVGFVSRGVRLEYCYAMGATTGYDCVGGLVGETGSYPYSTGLHLEQCYAIGLVTGESEVGGLIGLGTGGVSWYTGAKPYWDIDTTGIRSDALLFGQGRSTAEMKQQATFSGWDFANIWTIEEGGSYPQLRQMLSPSVTGLTPPHGPAVGGTSVVIMGTNLAGTTAVRFGMAAATSYAVNSATQITATAPAGMVGQKVPVTVTTPSGTSPITAAAEYCYDGWAVALQINHEAANTLIFGMAAGASDGWNADYDTLASAGINGAAVWMAADGTRLSRDLREPQSWSEWYLEVTAGATAGITVNWDATTVPTGMVLLLQQIDGDGLLVPGTAFDLADSTNGTEFTVGAGTTQEFRIICAPPATHNLELHPGWNLISLPLEPQNPQTSTIFSSVLNNVYLGSISSWGNGQQQPATELHAQRGYWLYALEDGAVSVSGGAATGRVNIQPGWNLLGPAAIVTTSALAFPLNTGTVWAWDHDFYRSVTELHPGSAYWLYAPATGPAYPDFHLGR